MTRHLLYAYLLYFQVQSDSLPTAIPAVPKSTCHPCKTYIITGGLGGFGLELANWLVDKGARSLILTSRSGVRTGYQARKLRYLRQFDVEVIVSTRNVCDKKDVKKLLQETSPRPVGGIFHLAMVNNDITCIETSQVIIRGGNENYSISHRFR